MYIVNPTACYLIGSAAIVIGIVTHSKKKKRLASWSHATATVQNVRRSDDSDAVVTVRFTDAGGQLRTASVTAAADSVSLGADLDIAYNPANPEDAFIREAKDMKLALYIPLAAGIILIGLGIVSQITLARAGYE